MAKDRGLKTRTPFSNSLDNQLWKDFQQLHEETKIPKSKLLDEAIELLLKSRASNQQSKN